MSTRTVDLEVENKELQGTIDLLRDAIRRIFANYQGLNESSDSLPNAIMHAGHLSGIWGIDLNTTEKKLGEPI